MNRHADDEFFDGHLKDILFEYLLPPKKHTNYNPGMKVIHDPLWGSRLFYPWEIALIDTPLIQRLRRIYQLGTAYLTYPSAVHTRFSHTLGVTILAGRLITRLKEKAEILKLDAEITLKDIYTVRMAGLLHDVGHCFFSHASEKILAPILAKQQKAFGLGDAKPHEFLSYLIVKNRYFLEYWEKYVSKLFKRIEDAPDPDSVAEIIVGIAPSKEKRFLQEIINGPYDVDKLEYLYRDSRTAGLEISYDIERYFYKIRLFKQEPDTWRLVMDQGGVRAVEQIIFSKMMLFSFVYHHQKVLASDLLIVDMLMELLNQDVKGDIKIEHPLDFLKYTDYDLLSFAIKGPSKRFEDIRNRLMNRELPKRCYVIGKEFVNNLNHDLNAKKNWDKLKNELRGLPQDVEKIREEIVKTVDSGKAQAQDLAIDDLYISFPKPPPIEEPMHAPVVDLNGKLHSMCDYFDLQGYQNTYDLKKLRGYFFTQQENVELSSRAIEAYLKNQYNLTFSSASRNEAKIS